MARSRGQRSLINALCAAALAAATGGIAGSTHVAAATGMVAIGSQPSWAAGQTGVAVDPNAIVQVSVVLKLRDQAGLDQFATAVSTPGSSQYRKYMTAAQFHDRFSPTQAAADVVSQYLMGNGLTITDIPDNRLYVRATGRAGAVGKAFNTHLAGYTVSGVVQTTTATVPTLPAAVAQYVDGVDGLSSPSAVAKSAHIAGNPGAVKHSTPVVPADTLPGPPYAFVNATPCSTYWGQKTASTVPPAYGAAQPWSTCGYTPTQLRGAYGTSALLRNGNDGRVVTVAIVDAYAAPTIVADANQYSRNHGEPTLRTGQFRQVNAPTFTDTGWPSPANPNGCGAQGWYGEETLDVEAVHAMAPAANILYLGASSCADFDLIARDNLAIDHEMASVISNSWTIFGGFDALLPAEQRAYAHTFQQGVAEGISVLFSSGDSGDELLFSGNRTVEYPASDPWVTGVGGTSLAVGATNNYLFETGWGTSQSILVGGAWSPAPPGDFGYGSGGGTSQVFGQPSYQRGIVPASISGYFGGNGRAVPDISLDADPQTGFVVGETEFFPADPNDPNNPNGSNLYGESVFGGTSLSSPLFAGMMALANQGQHPAIGFVNPALYRLSGTSALRDVINPPRTVAVVRNDFNNGIDATGGVTTAVRTMNTTQTLATRPGYDDVTGLGTPRGASFISALANNESGQQSG